MTLRTCSLLLLALAVPCLQGCGPDASRPAYHLAKACVRVADAVSGAALGAQPDDSYALVDPAGADAFFVQPTGLGTFLLYDEQQGFLAAQGTAPARLAAASDRVEWTIHFAEAGHEDGLYQLVSTADGTALDLASGAPTLRPPSAAELTLSGRWRLEALPTESCTAYPEASLDATVAPGFHEPRDPGAPAVGFADLHAHFGFPKAMGALAMSGGIFHRFGLPYALADCDDLHGPNGSLDLLGSQTGAAGHDTTGYPHFTEWPQRSSTTHVQAYYRWIERAYLSGLRLAVTDATGNRPLCQAMGFLNPGRLEGDCTPSSTVALQTRYIYEIQDYVDAQAGGPGEGWFRVVLSSEQARKVIAQNKLAVVLGVEYSELFACGVDDASCTPDYVEQELDALHALGVRSAFPIHRFDNAFGGARLQNGDSGAWMNLANKIVTTGVDSVFDLLSPQFQGGGAFWEVEACPPGVVGASGVSDMQAFADRLPSLNPIFAIFEAAGVFDKFQPIPTYAELAGVEAVCNPRPLQQIGETLLHGMIDRGMIIEIDHLSPATLEWVLALLEHRGYSGFVSSHSWIENRADVRQRIFALGGLMSPFNGSPSSVATSIESRMVEMAAHPYLIGLGVGTDVQGVTSQASGDAGRTTTYPFTSVDGQVTFQPPKTGLRGFDFDQEGLAHYGLLPEWVEQLRQADAETPADVMGAFMSSAEAYLQMWERAEAAAR